MSRFEFKLPDLGEGTVDAEIVEWKVKAGDHVKEDDVIVDVMTDKANIEVPAPVSGTVVSTTGEPGDRVPVGATLIVFEVTTGAGAKVAAKPVAAAEVEASPAVPAAYGEISATHGARGRTASRGTARGGTNQPFESGCRHRDDGAHLAVDPPSRARSGRRSNGDSRFGY